MRIVRGLAALWCTCWGISAAEPEEIYQKLDEYRPEIVRLLEAKDFKEALRHAVPPEQLAAVMGKDSLDAFAVKFGERRAPQLLAVLKAVAGVKPKMSADGKMATFEVPGGVKAPRKDIVFQLIEKHWYIAN